MMAGYSKKDEPLFTIYYLLFTEYELWFFFFVLHSSTFQTSTLFTIHQVYLFELDQPTIPRSLLKMDIQNHELVRWELRMKLTKRPENPHQFSGITVKTTLDGRIMAAKPLPTTEIDTTVPIPHFPTEVILLTLQHAYLQIDDVYET
jgi:hypothetical protein